MANPIEYLLMRCRPGAADPEHDLRFIRRQAAGTQFGYDIEFEYFATGNPAVRGHVECKNIDRPIGIDDVGPNASSRSCANCR